MIGRRDLFLDGDTQRKLNVASRLKRDLAPPTATARECIDPEQRVKGQFIYTPRSGSHYIVIYASRLGSYVWDIACFNCALTASYNHS